MRPRTRFLLLFSYLQAGEASCSEVVRDCKAKEAYPWDVVDPDDIHGYNNSTKAERNSDDRRIVAKSAQSSRPNLLSPKPTLGGQLTVQEITSAPNR